MHMNCRISLEINSIVLNSRLHTVQENIIVQDTVSYPFLCEGIYKIYVANLNYVGVAAVFFFTINRLWVVPSN